VVQNRTRERAITRCHRADAGLTRADLFHKGDAAICIYFARGSCINGPNCTLFHRIPCSEADERRLTVSHDCFGRERHREDREDMGGVGSMMRPCKTLYIGGISVRFSVG
jgi:hypothetical protein